jgi:sulfatase maturation enzyme AslB (radical SAM superfamily)
MQCNRACDYCWLREIGAPCDLGVLPASAWLEFFERSGQPLRLDLVGGEPLLYPELEKLLTGIQGLGHSWVMTTNLCADPSALFEVEPRDKTVIVSLHLDKDVPTQIERAEALRQYGYCVIFSIVTGVDNHETHVPMVEALGFRVDSTPYCAPQESYCESGPGWLCNAGSGSVFVVSNGDVYACWTHYKASFRDGAKPLDNIADGFEWVEEAYECNLQCETPQRMGLCGVCVYGRAE